jgi:23S rRNA U2552 (ribose-2'-O)-methylase RlmE/FtsJ
MDVFGIFRDSRKPDMAEIFQRKADFLKICNTFLKDKRTLAAEFQQALEENKDLAYVTRKFEEVCK